MRNSVKANWSIEPMFCIILALTILIFPIKWVWGWFAAIIVHELGHYLALRACNIDVSSMRIGLTGIIMTTGMQTFRQSMICSLAGPAFGFILLFFSRFTPYISICGFVQSVYNLLPIYPLDGGRVLHALLGIFLEEQKTVQYTQLIGNITICLILILTGYWTIYYRLIKIVVVIVTALVTKMILLKIPCKQDEVIVQ